MIKARHFRWIVFLVVAVAAGVVQAADFPVAAGDVPQLIAAIAAANADGVADVINLAGGSYDLATADNTSVTNGANGLPVVTSAITINGNGAVIRRTGAPAFRIFQVGAGGALTLNAVTVSGGSAPGGSGAGGGILLSDDTNSLTLTDSTITGNSATVFGGGIAIRGTSQAVTLTRTTVSSNTAVAGGGIEVQAAQVTLTLDHSRVSGNTAHSGSTVDGGGISISGGPHTIRLTDSVVDGNTASSDTGSAEGGGISSSAEVTYTIVGTTISNNHATGGTGVGAGGGINDSGGAIWTMSNSTISGNSASGDVAFLGGGGIESDSSPAAFTLKNVTITNNQARQGGGIDVSAGAVVLENTILANNGGPASSPDCAGPLTSHGHNLIKNTTGCVVALGASDITNQDPLLGPLADNGGPTLTHALLAGSPAADAGDPAGCKDGANVLLTTDQREFVRPFGAACDIGAFERGLVVEDCDNCLDDDGNQLVDREDPACLPDANGNQVGLGDTKRGKALGKCAAALAKAGAKLGAGESKRLQKCLQTAFVCVQQKSGDGKCLAKAQKACGLATLRRPLDLEKYGVAVRAKCAPPVLAADELLGLTGLAFQHEAPLCERFGISSINSVDDVVSCTASLQACRSQAMVGMEFPRAPELLTFAGASPGSFACLGAGANGAGSGAGDPKREGKRAGKCAKGISKAGAKFASGKCKLVQKCALAVSKCMQEKSVDAKCLPKARKTCAKQIAKLSGPKGLEAKLAATVIKSCDTPGLGLTATLAATGIGFDVWAAECHGLGVASLDGVGVVGTCLARQHECRVEQALEAALPRLRELLDLGQVSLP